MTKPKLYKSIVVSVMVGIMMGFIIFALKLLEDNIGHTIAIASFAGTTVSIFLNSKSPNNLPHVVFLSYVLASFIGFLVSLLNFELFIQVTIAMIILVLLFIICNLMHPPAVAYALGFLLGGYSFIGVLLTIPVLFIYFITLGVVVLVVEFIATQIGLIPKDVSTTYEVPTTWKSKIEKIVHDTVPFALVLLFISLSIEFLYPEFIDEHELGVYLGILDWIILGFLAVDLVFIYMRVNSFKLFVKNHWIDILATIPFFIVLRFFHGATLVMALFARGTAEAFADATRFSRFLRPVARTPRFTRLLDKLDDVGL